MKQEEGERSRIGHKKRGVYSEYRKWKQTRGGRKCTPKGKVFVFSSYLLVYL